MADNSTVGAPVGTGDTIRDKDRAGVKTQIVGLDLNIGGSETLMTGAMPTDLTTTAVADGGTLPAKGVQVGGTDGTVYQVMSTDAAGRVNTNINGTVPVSAASLPLPAGAATAAKQPALGTAGTPSADVISVQGVASMTAVKTDGSGVTQPVSGTVTATGPLTDAQLRASAPSVDTELPAAAALADAAANPTTPMVGSAGLVWNGTTWDRLRGDTTNGAFVNVKTSVLPTGASTSAKQPALGTAGAASADVLSVQGVASMTALKVDGSAVTQPVSLAGTQSVNTAQVAGTTTDTNSGVKSAGTQRVVLATDQPALTNALKVDPSAVTSPVSLAALPALTAGSAQIGTTSLTPQTSGGLTTFHLVSAASVNATNVKASAGQLYGWFIRNTSTTDGKVAFHNTAGTPTAGASIFFSLNIPAGGAANVFGSIGIPFATGIGITTVTDAADAGTTAVALSALDINLFYK